MTPDKAYVHGLLVGRDGERDRIVTLLEEHQLYEDMTGTYCSCDIDNAAVSYNDHIMELIKAEN